MHNMDANPIRDIEAAAKAAGVPINEALSDAGVSQTTWWRWSTGRFDPRYSTLRRITSAIETLAASRLAKSA